MNSRRSLVLSLFDYTGNMVQPWAEAGHDTQKAQPKVDIFS